MAPKKQNNRTKLSLAQALEKLGYKPKSDMKDRGSTFYDPYDEANVYFPDPMHPLRRDNTYNRVGESQRKKDAIYTEKFSKVPDITNLEFYYRQMPEYDGIPKKEKNRKKLAEALSRHIGKLLPF